MCLDRQKLPIATDTVDFMLCKNLAVDQAMLQILLHKLAKQNLWLRAREIFRREYHNLITCIDIDQKDKAENLVKCRSFAVVVGLLFLFSCNSCSPDSLSVGYYPAVSAPPGFMALIVPCELGEVELALTLEMLITVNPTILHLSETTSCCLSITLKR